MSYTHTRQPHCPPHTEIELVPLPVPNSHKTISMDWMHYYAGIVFVNRKVKQSTLRSHARSLFNITEKQSQFPINVQDEGL